MTLLTTNWFAWFICSHGKTKFENVSVLAACSPNLICTPTEEKKCPSFYSKARLDLSPARSSLCIPHAAQNAPVVDPSLPHVELTELTAAYAPDSVDHNSEYHNYHIIYQNWVGPRPQTSTQLKLSRTSAAYRHRNTNPYSPGGNLPPVARVQVAVLSIGYP